MCTKFKRSLQEEKDKSRHNLWALSTASESENPDDTELYTDLSTLSTKNAVEKMVYIVFSANGRFVDYDKIGEMRNKF